MERPIRPVQVQTLARSDCFLQLPVSFLPFKFGIPNAHTWLSGGISVGMACPDTHKTLGENKMNALKKLIVGMVSVLCAIPAMAQIANSVTFDAPSAFYAGNAKMPAGSYRVTQPNADDNLLLLETADGSHSVFVEYEVASADSRHTQSDVTFNKYGSVDFLSAIWVEGRKSEMQILPSKFEQNTAKAAAAEKHSLSAKSAGQP
jgi:hypothetical protein